MAGTCLWNLRLIYRKIGIEITFLRAERRIKPHPKKIKQEVLSDYKFSKTALNHNSMRY